MKMKNESLDFISTFEELSRLMESASDLTSTDVTKAIMTLIKKAKPNSLYVKDIFNKLAANFDLDYAKAYAELSKDSDTFCYVTTEGESVIDLYFNTLDECTYHENGISIRDLNYDYFDSEECDYSEDPLLWLLDYIQTQSVTTIAETSKCITLCLNLSSEQLINAIKADFDDLMFSAAWPGVRL